MSKIRTFESGATRDNNTNKRDVMGFTSAVADKLYCDYMHEHRFQSDGTIRPSDNYKKGIPKEAVTESLGRHALDLRLIDEGYSGRESEVATLCAMRFAIDNRLIIKAKENPELLEFEEDEK